MTFELPADALGARDAARTLAETVRLQAVEIDRTATVPAPLAEQVARLGASEPLTTVVIAEEIATASAAVAVSMVAGRSRAALGLAGLRGAGVPDDSLRAQLALAGVALGLGRAAMAAALDDVRAAAATASGVEKPQWLIADVATDLDAARLLTYQAAGTMADGDIALARLLASAAAQRAVDAAVRVAGMSALAEGSALERLSRDVRVLSVLLGTEETQRTVAAEALLPK